ncbi:hypothetical protein [Actinomadura oligospora]|uniref:hypothetical protein n=1 Tax=Actinomadura oligospora TaxID=111804 RepID=UPI0004B87385|nr:hypothetical protein [Actinomadura oligospora]
MRYTFGASMPDWTMSADTNGVVRVAAGVALTFWSAPVDGLQYVDLLNMLGEPISTVYSGDGEVDPVGAIPQFKGPEDVAAMWADTGSGSRTLIVATDAATAATALIPDMEWAAKLRNNFTNTGTVGQVLSRDSSTELGVAWTTPASGGGGGGSATVDRAFGVPMDSFPGSSDTAKFEAALSWARAQPSPSKPTIVMPNRQITIDGGPYDLFPGLKLAGPGGSLEREFSDSAQCVVVTPRPLFQVPAAGVRNVSIRGIQFKASGTVDWLVRATDFSAGPIMQDCDFSDIAWVGYSSVMHARQLRCSIQRMYCNNGTDTQFKLGGSDNYYWTEGYSYLSGSVPVAGYYVYFNSMSRTRVGAVYVTPQVATAFRVEGGYGGLLFNGTIIDCTGRNATLACQGSGIHITGGEGHVFRDLWFFNVAVNVAAVGTNRADKGMIFVRATAKNVLIAGCQFSGGAKQTVVTPAGTPAVYAESGATVRVASPIAPNGGEKILQQAAAGGITCDDASWTIKTAA